jgi:antitoxin (DNA-binding transcriptional repressor) of toxin-antitoxin stability system
LYVRPDTIETSNYLKMTVSATAFRQNIYKFLDRIDEKGEPIEVERKGRRYKMVPIKARKSKSKKKGSIFDNLVTRDDVLNCDPEELVHIDWSKYWNEEKNLS